MYCVRSPSNGRAKLTPAIPFYSTYLLPAHLLFRQGGFERFVVDAPHLHPPASQSTPARYQHHQPPSMPASVTPCREISIHRRNTHHNMDTSDKRITICTVWGNGKFDLLRLIHPHQRQHPHRTEYQRQSRHAMPGHMGRCFNSPHRRRTHTTKLTPRRR